MPQSALNGFNLKVPEADSELSREQFAPSQMGNIMELKDTSNFFGSKSQLKIPPLKELSERVVF